MRSASTLTSAARSSNHVPRSSRRGQARTLSLYPIVSTRPLGPRSPTNCRTPAEGSMLDLRDGDQGRPAALPGARWRSHGDSIHHAQVGLLPLITTGISTYPARTGAPLHVHNCDEQVHLARGAGRGRDRRRRDTSRPVRQHLHPRRAATRVSQDRRQTDADPLDLPDAERHADARLHRRPSCTFPTRT
jgi:hypothetical protein